MHSAHCACVWCNAIMGVVNARLATGIGVAGVCLRVLLTLYIHYLYLNMNSYRTLGRTQGQAHSQPGDVDT